MRGGRGILSLMTRRCVCSCVCEYVYGKGVGKTESERERGASAGLSRHVCVQYTCMHVYMYRTCVLVGGHERASERETEI